MHTLSPADFNPAMRPLMLATASRQVRGDASRAARRTGTVFRQAANHRPGGRVAAGRVTLPSR